MTFGHGGFPIHFLHSRPAGCACARARQQGVALPLVISDHADWNGLIATIAATGASEIWVTHGQEDALVHWCASRGLKARPLDIVGYGEEEDVADTAAGDGGNDDAAAPPLSDGNRDDDERP